MRRILSSVAVVLALSGCVRFTDQEIRLAYDEPRDRLDLLVVYHGISYDGSPGVEVDSKKRACDFAAGIGRGEPWVGFGGFFTPLTERKDDVVAQAMLPLVTVRQGQFFLDRDRRPSLWQCIRIEPVRKFLALLNAGIQRSFSDPQWRSRWLRGMSLSDAHTEELFARALQNDWAFVSLRGNAIELKIPCSDAGHHALVSERLLALVQSVRTQPAEKIELPLRCLAETDLSFMRTGEETALVLGNPDRNEQVLHLPGVAECEPNLVPVLEQRQIELVDHLGDEDLLQRFAEFRAR